MTNNIKTFEDLAEACKKSDDKTIVRIQKRMELYNMEVVLCEEDDFRSILRIELHGDIKFNTCSIASEITMDGKTGKNFFGFSHDFNKILKAIYDIKEIQDDK